MKRSILAAIFLAASVGVALAQSSAPADPHHPTESAPGVGSSAVPGDSSMSKRPANSDTQKSSAPMNMMDGNIPMMNMMGGDGSMMNMMSMMMDMRDARMGMSDHIEGRIAFLRAELKITDSQGNAFNAVADAMRLNAKKFGELRAPSSSASPSQSGSDLVDRLGLQERWLSARLEGIRGLKPAVGNLYAVLSDEQKKTADELLPAHIGLDPMMNASMQRMGQMSPGRPPQDVMRPGQMMRGPMRQ